MASDPEIIVRLLLASVLGGLVGLEREVHGREAGIRTYLLVALGSALIMVVSEVLFFKYQGMIAGEFVRVDPGRIAAQAVTGIGFLGAGVIIRYGNSIRGLTTAACMWVTCAVGLAIGSGYYIYGSVVSFVTLFSLIALKMVREKLSTDWYRDLTVLSEELDGQFERLQAIIEKYGVKVTGFSLRKDRQKQEIVVNFRLRFHTAEPLDRSILNETYAIPGIKSVELK
ncbi:MAG: putative Mg(2+) transport ATPase [Syntrophorhabdaceae bacterium PtaU1.Bin034]|nr:MAG: putative Mg(2+) transport ATPase [Syntrophorhabdaceae bacterium PtaU1.Bin034]